MKLTKTHTCDSEMILKNVTLGQSKVSPHHILKIYFHCKTVYKLVEGLLL